MQVVRSNIPKFLKAEWLKNQIHQLSRAAHAQVNNILEEERHVSESVWTEAKPFENIPGPKPLPIIGNIWRFLPIIGEYHNKLPETLFGEFNDKYGNIVKMEGVVGTRDMIFVFDPNDFETVYRQEAVYPQRILFPSYTYFRSNYMQDIFGKAKGLISSNMHEWHEFRTKVNPTMMQPRVIKPYITDVETIADEFVELFKRNLDDKNHLKLDLLEESKKWSIESIAFIATSTRLGALDENNSSPLGKELVETSVKVFELSQELDYKPSLWRVYPTKKFREAMKYNQAQVVASIKVIDAAIKRINENKDTNVSEREASVLEKLYKIDPNVAIVMTTDMLLAGVETTSSALITALYYLAANRDKQDILRKEILKYLPNKSDKLTLEALNSMIYLKACIKESSRLFPVTTAIIRDITKDTVLSGYRIPKGKTVILCHMNASIRDGNFPRNKEFLPERWLRENADSDFSFKKAHPFSMMPFGFGSRSCVGKRFADLELETAVISFMRNFDISIDGPHPQKPTFGMNVFLPPYNFVYKVI